MRDGHESSGPAARRGRWSRADRERLKELYGLRDDAAVARALQRSVASVRRMVEKLFPRATSTGPWTELEVAELRRHLGACAPYVIARILGCTVEDVERLAREHALAKDKGFARRTRGWGATRMPRWRAEEIQFLKREYAAGSNLELARMLGRSVKSLLSKSHHLGLRKSTERRRRMGQENVSIRYVANGSSHDE